MAYKPQTPIVAPNTLENLATSMELFEGLAMLPTDRKIFAIENHLFQIRQDLFDLTQMLKGFRWIPLIRDGYYSSDGGEKKH
jgi:hypothetical protein